MAQRNDNDMLGQLLFLGAGLVATLVVRKAIGVAWVAATGRSVPDDPADPAVSSRDAVVFAVATGAALGVSRMLIQRQINLARARRAAKEVAA
jgi:hypothetical protein